MNPLYHPKSEEVVDFLCTKVMSDNKHFFRILTAYYFSKMASMVRTNIKTKERGIIPVNTYALNLMASGEGKGHSTNIIEEALLSGFKEKFMSEVFPAVANNHIQVIAQQRAIRDQVDTKDWTKALVKEFHDLGPLPFSFDSATGPAIKQLRNKLLLASSGSMNIEIDEIGHNLVGNSEALAVLFELYDKGLVKQKLIKNTKENTRTEEIEGYTPCNLMMFGNQYKLLDGAKVEEELMEMLLSGYARRLLFGYSPNSGRKQNITAEQMYDMLTDTNVNSKEVELRNYFTSLGSKVGPLLTVSKSVTIELIQYKLDCEKLAENMSEFQETEKAEMAHRYFKVLKQSGTYAFVDKELEISSKNLGYAIELVEASGVHFKRIITSEGPYTRLAKYISSIEKDVTEVDLAENLPFYRGNKEQKRQMMTMAIAWGYRNNVIIKKTMLDGIEFFSGESLDETNLDEIIIAYSKDVTSGYSNEIQPLSKLKLLFTLPAHNFISHHVHDGYRDEEHISLPTGCNIVVIDVDGGIQLHEAELLLKDYTYSAYETKSSTGRKNRFRLIMPLSHIVKLTKDDYTIFMENIYNWLPFDCDTATKDRCRKWLTCDKGRYVENTGKLIDATMFIPRTDKADKQENYVTETQDMSNLQRWFYNNISVGNRNSTLLRYALSLLDNGMHKDEIRRNVLEFNEKIADPMDELRIERTILQTITHRAAKRSKKGKS